MRIVDRFGFFIFLSWLLSISSISSAHDVDEPVLERLPIWSRCCGGHDCTPQRVKIIGKEVRDKVAVEIEGTQTKVDKGKLSPVPSSRAWVCYVDPKGEIANDNIRCILFPENRGSVEAPHPRTTPNGGVQARQ